MLSFRRLFAHTAWCAPGRSWSVISGFLNAVLGRCDGRSASILALCQMMCAVVAGLIPGMALAQPSTNQPNGPTFDCRIASAPAELRICVVPDLARLDVDLDHAYSERVAGLTPEQNNALKLAQRTWMRRRNACGASEGCLRQIMQERIAELRVGMPPTSYAAAPPAYPVPGQQPAPYAVPGKPADARTGRQQYQGLPNNPQVQAPQEENLDQRRERLIEARRLASYSGPPPVPDATPPGDEWRGAFTCEGTDRFLRLVLPARADAAGNVAPVMEIGPGPDNNFVRASLRMAGVFPPGSGQVHLEPQAWIHQGHDLIGDLGGTFGLEGNRSADGKVIGKVIGLAKCTEFRVWHIVPPTEAPNANGLLFKAHPMNVGEVEPRISDDECRSFVQWIASGRELQFGFYYLSSLYFDTEGQRRVLGKTVEQYDREDPVKFRNISGACRARIEKSATLNDTALMLQVKVWNIQPFDQDRANWNLSAWNRAQLIALLWPEAKARAASRLASLASLPPTAESFGNYDKEALLAKRTDGPMHYLEKADLPEYQKAVEDGRAALASKAIAAMAAILKSYPANTAGLIGMKEEAKQTEDLLVRVRVPDAARRVNQAYQEAAAAKAVDAWAAFYADAGPKLAALDGAFYDRFPELMKIRADEQTLMAVQLPTDAHEQQSYRTAYDNARNRMVERSEPQLVAWVTALTPSATANTLMERFINQTFSGPPGDTALQAAIATKRAAYNPDNLIRPDIVMAIERRVWSEVSRDGIEDLAYFGTSLGKLKTSCPGLVPDEGTPQSMALVNYALQASKQAVARAMRGEAKNSAEAARTVALFATTLANHPGCSVNGFGERTCRSLQDVMDVNTAMMTSGDAIADMQKLSVHGCDSPEIRDYVQGALELAGASSRSNKPAPYLIEPWKAVVPNQDAAAVK
jgi:uncharacterized protein YecT (DUF1311 family)